MASKCFLKLLANSRQVRPSIFGLYNSSPGLRFSSCSTYEFVLTEKKGAKQNVGLITLNRPKALNALNSKLVSEITDAVAKYDKDDSIGAIIITGSEKAFAAGADIKEMLNLTYPESIKNKMLTDLGKILQCKKPVIAAVNGYALGGGNELAMLCDIIYAGDKAAFGQPEINIGTIPGIGGTQRIARSCGKSKAMEICLTGNPVTAQEAEKMGLVSKVFPADKLIEETVKTAERIASHSPLIVALCKESVNSAFETTLQEGLRFERKTFNSTFATDDRKEGMSAFVEKRKPSYSNK